MIFETHAHLDDEKFNEDREQLIQGLRDEGIEYIVNVGANIETSKNTLALIDKYDMIYGAIGVHPHDAKELDEDKLSWLKQQTENKKIVAIGEIGLDYYYDNSDREVQKYWFARQIELAKEVSLPIIVHSRDAALETMNIIKDTNAAQCSGIIHCFSYSYEMAKEYVDMGFYLGIGGVLTFDKSKKLKEIVEKIPINMLVLETDCPYLTPVPFRGKRNSPEYLPYIARELASIKGITYEEVIEATSQNAIKLYGIKRG